MATSASQEVVRVSEWMQQEQNNSFKRAQNEAKEDAKALAMEITRRTGTKVTVIQG